MSSNVLGKTEVAGDLNKVRARCSAQFLETCAWDISIVVNFDLIA